MCQNAEGRERGREELKKVGIGKIEKKDKGDKKGEK